MWPTLTEQSHQTQNVHGDPNYACPTAKTGLLGGGAFLSLDSALFWLIALMLACNAREDYFDDGKVEADRAAPATAPAADRVVEVVADA